MPNVNIDGNDYDLNDLNEEAKRQLANVQFAQSEIQRLNGLLAVMKTAAATYSSALKKELND